MSSDSKLSNQKAQSISLADRVFSTVIIFLFKGLDLMPYQSRVRFGGWLLQYILAPLLGYRKRILTHLKFVYPDMKQEEAKVLARKISNNVGRSFVEISSPDGLMQRAAQAPLTGAGVDVLERAQESGQPVILVSGHFGNYDAVRYAMLNKGYRVGGLYRNMKFQKFNDFYVSRISKLGGTLFPRERSGMAKMIKYLRQGNVLALLPDQHMKSGVPLDFLGKPAYTALSAAEMALKYDAVLLPVYGVRQADGLSFEIQVEAPIQISDAVTMSQQLNDSLSAMVHKHKEQWFWVHKRWKV